MLLYKGESQLISNFRACCYFRAVIRTVILDFDDTLSLTEAAGFALENEVLRLMGRGPMTREIHIETWGTPTLEAMDLRSPGIDKDRFREIFAEQILKSASLGTMDVVTDENIATLDLLIKQEKQLLILTSRRADELTHLMAPEHILAGRIKGFYHKDNIRFIKPDPRAFDELLNDHSIASSEAVYVGDSLSDAIAAKDAGLYFIASLESGIRTEKDFENLAVDAFVESFSELPRTIENLELLLENNSARSLIYQPKTQSPVSSQPHTSADLSEVRDGS